MNFASVCAVLMEEPREVYTSETSFNLRALVNLPPVGNKAATPVELNVYGKPCEKFRTYKSGTRLHINGAKLRFDVQSRTYSLHGGVVYEVTESTPILNDVILSGRCIKDIDEKDERVFRTTADGLMICNQTLSVPMGKNKADLFNFFAINSSKDRLNNAELIANYTRKGVGLTIHGKLVTDAWTDKATKERRTATKIQVSNLTLPPKPSENGAVESQVKPVVSNTSNPSAENTVNLWASNNTQADPWNHASGGGLPDLPGQYGSAPSLEEIPF